MLPQGVQAQQQRRDHNEHAGQHHTGNQRQGHHRRDRPPCLVVVLAGKLADQHR
jgi:hypothetical protein